MVLINRDDEIIQSAVSGDPEAFNRLYEMYVDRIYNYIYFRIGNQYEAEDLTGRVFFRALNHIKTYQNRGLPFSAWLYRIAHNLVANWHRDNSKRKEVSLDDYTHLQSGFDTPENDVIHGIDNQKLIECIQKLPPDRQQILILKFVEHLSNDEIGVIMSRSEGAIKSLYHRTLIMLREELQKQENIGS